MMDAPSAEQPNPGQAGATPRIVGGGIVGIAIRQPVFTTMVMVGLMVLGLFSLNKLGIEEYPDVSIPILTIQTIYPGATPASVERQVTKPIEDAVHTTQGIRRITSQSYESLSIVVVEYQLGTDLIAAAAEVRSKIEQVRRIMPTEIDTPIVQQVDLAQQPIISLALVSTNQTLRELSGFVETRLQRELEGISGVGRLETSGMLKREIRVELQPSRMFSLDISANQVINALRSQNLDIPAGRIKRGSQEFLVRVDGSLDNPNEFADVTIANFGASGSVRLSQIANVLNGTAEQRSLALVDGVPAIGIDLLKAGGANTVEVAARVREAVKGFQAKLPPGTRLEVIRDNSKNISDSVDSVRDELLMGALLTVAIVFLFLNDLRATIITALALPICVISTFSVLHILDFTLNAMTLLGLSLSIGLLIDDAIVVIESAVRHRGTGKNPFSAALEGTNEIFLAVMASTFTIVAVFVPVAFMGGIVGKLFFQFGITVAWSILVSLFVSFTLTPMLTAWWGGGHGLDRPPSKGPIGRSIAAFNRSFDRLATGYRRVIHWTLVHRITAIGLALATFVGALGLTPYVGGGFMPKVDTGDFSVTFEAPSGFDFDYTGKKAREIDLVLRSIPGVVGTFTTIGSGVSQSVNSGEVYVKLSPAAERRLDLDGTMELARQRLSSIYGVTTSVSGTAGLGSGSKPIQISISGPRLEELERIADTIVSSISGIPGVIEISSSAENKVPEVEIVVDPDLASAMKLDSAAVISSIQPLLGGQLTTRWRDSDGRQIDVRLELDTKVKTTDSMLMHFPIQRAGPRGIETIRLGQVAVIRQNHGVALIEHLNLDRVVNITANLQGRSLSEASKDIEGVLKGLKLADGYSTSLGGDTEQLRETTGYVIQAIALAAILIYLILASQFGSFLQPMAIMFSVPLALSGVLIALLATRDTLNIMSMIGVIMLLGIVTKNAILLIDSANERRRGGLSIREALVEAGETRLRPIMMTSLATVFGMLPIALGLGAGGEARAPMARAVIGGLITSTLLTLLVIPVVYTYLEGFGSWMQRLFGRPAGSDTTSPMA